MRIKKQLSCLLILGFVLASLNYYGHALLDRTINYRDQNRALFQKMGLNYLKNIEFNLSSHPKCLDVKSSKRYLVNPAFYDSLEQKYGVQIAQGAVVPMSIRFINSKIGYGVFAEAQIAQDQMIGEYTGIVMESKDIKDTKYTWEYLSDYDDSGKEYKLSIDAIKSGNEMRFSNHDDLPNAVMKYVPQGGVWHTVYIASKPIKKGEQILTNYGKRYWTGSRGEPYKFVQDDGTQRELVG